MPRVKVLLEVSALSFAAAGLASTIRVAEGWNTGFMPVSSRLAMEKVPGTSSFSTTGEPESWMNAAVSMRLAHQSTRPSLASARTLNGTRSSLMRPLERTALRSWSMISVSVL